MPELDQLQEGLYSIKVVERLTGLSADTIRVWERRYRAVEPRRTSGGTRQFSAKDVRRLALLRQATGQGHRIRHIAQLSEEALHELVDEVQDLPAKKSDSLLVGSDPYAQLRQEYFAATERFDSSRATELLLRAAALLNRKTFLFQVALPVLRETGRRWESGELSIAQEHLISAQLRGLLDALLRFASPQPGAPKVVVTTPAGHRHELGVTMGAMMAASHGYHVIYLGPDTPEAEIVRAVEASGADLVLLGVLRDLEARELTALGASLGRLQQQAEVWVGISPGHPLAAKAPGVQFFERFEDFEAALTARSASRRGGRGRRRVAVGGLAAAKEGTWKKKK